MISAPPTEDFCGCFVSVYWSIIWLLNNNWNALVQHNSSNSWKWELKYYLLLQVIRKGTIYSVFYLSHFTWFGLTDWICLMETFKKSYVYQWIRNSQRPSDSFHLDHVQEVNICKILLYSSTIKLLLTAEIVSTILVTFISLPQLKN